MCPKSSSVKWTRNWKVGVWQNAGNEGNWIGLAEWATLTVFDPKKDGSLRLYMTYEKEEEVTGRSSYPIARMDEGIDSLGDLSYFSILEANCGYWRVGI